MSCRRSSRFWGLGCPKIFHEIEDSLVINYATRLVGDSRLLESVRKALHTLRTHAERVIRRWTSTYTNARMEGLNSLFQAARGRARGYRNTETFITMIYMIASPAGSVLKPT